MGKKARNLAIVIFNYFILSIWAIFFLSLGRFHSIFFSVRWAVVSTIDGGGRSWWWWCWWQMGGMMGGLRYLSTLVHTPWRVLFFLVGPIWWTKGVENEMLIATFHVEDLVLILSFKSWNLKRELIDFVVEHWIRFLFKNMFSVS